MLNSMSIFNVMNLRRKKPPRLRLWIVASISLVLVSMGQSGAGSDPFCSPDKTLDTKYFGPILEAQQNIEIGCISSERSSQGLYLHYIKINTTTRSILLSVTDNQLKGDGHLLVLDSTVPVDWRLAFMGDKFQSQSVRIQVILSKGSRVLGSNAKINSQEFFDDQNHLSNLSNDGNLSDQEASNLLRATFGGLTTYSRVRNANRISILMPPSFPKACVLSKVNPSQGAINVYFMKKQSTTGCYHTELSGLQESDVHIIDINSADGVLTENDDGLLLPPVYLSLVAERDLIQRNISLILRSKQNVKWVLQSKGLSGEVIVFVRDKSSIQEMALPDTLRIVVKERDIPSSFEGLLRLSQAETNVMPISYLKVDKSNLMSLIVAKKSETDLQDVPTRRSYVEAKVSSQDDLAEKKVLIPGEVINDVVNQEEVNEAFSHITVQMTLGLDLNCGSSLTKVTLDRSTTKGFGVEKVTFNEPACAASKNSTHWIIEKPSTSCGSLSKFSNSDSPTFSNNVVIHFTRQSKFFPRTVEIPFECKLKVGVLAGDEEYESIIQGGSNGKSNANFVDSDDRDEMYLMRVTRDQTSSSLNKRYTQILLESRSESANVSPGDTLTVLTDFETKFGLSLAIDQCWLSSKFNDEDSRHIPEQNMLITKGCPSEGSTANVSISKRQGNANPKFSFILSDSIREMEKVYIFCKIGLCSNDQSSAAGNIALCQNPMDFCSSINYYSASQYQTPTALQLTRRGPLYVHPFLLHQGGERDHSIVKEETEFEGRQELYNPIETGQASPGLHSSHVVMVGVPAEIAVAIALASFVIGAGLTGMLCCIHHRKVSPKVVRSHAVTADSSELQSMMTSHQNNEMSSNNNQGCNGNAYIANC